MKTQFCLAVLAAFAGVACGNTMPGGNQGNGTCTATLSGAATGSYDCYAIGTFNAPMNDAGPGNSSLAIAISGADASVLYANFVLDLGTTFNAGGYTPNNTVQDAITVSLGSGTPHVWEMTENVSTTPNQGTFALTLTSPGTSFTTATGTTGYLHPAGTLTATLPPQSSSGATGSVSLSVVFANGTDGG